MNINQTCNGFWNGSTINFYRSGGGCRNTGELAGVFDHEWGHGMDDNDANGAISNSGEGYADIAAIYRYQDSCVGHGFFLPPAGSCGLTADGTGRNTDEDQTAGVHCATDCSGVRDADYGKHSDGLPDTALGHVCSRCLTGTGPCGRQVHCAAAPQRQAAWDLVARDLPALGFDSQTAFVIGNRLFYQGSGNIGTWYACTCGSHVQRLRRHQRLHPVDHRRRRQRQPERRHAAHDRHLQRVQPARHRLRHPDRGQQRLQRPAQWRPGPTARRPPPATTRRRSPGTPSPGPPATRCSAPRACRLQLRQGQDRRP